MAGKISLILRHIQILIIMVNLDTFLSITIKTLSMEDMETFAIFLQMVY